MAINTSATRTTELEAAGQENNPFVTPATLTGTATTDTGTEVQAASNALTGTTFDQWTATNPGAGCIWEVDLGAPATPTALGFAAHNFGTSVVAGGGAARFRYWDGAAWQNAGEAFSPEDGEACVQRLGTSEITAQRWQLRTTLTTGNVSCGVIFIGSEIVIPQRFYQGFAPPITPNMVDLNTNVSEGAHLLGSAVTVRGSRFQVTVDHLTPAFIRGSTWTSFQRRWNSGFGTLFAWRPAKYGDVNYAWREQGDATIAPTNSGPKDYMSFNMAGRMYHV